VDSESIAFVGNVVGAAVDDVVGDFVDPMSVSSVGDSVGSLVGAFVDDVVGAFLDPIGPNSLVCADFDATELMRDLIGLIRLFMTLFRLPITFTTLLDVLPPVLALHVASKIKQNVRRTLLISD